MAQWYGAGGCPPGMYQPAAGYDCRPNVSGQVIQQQQMAALAAHYTEWDNTATSGQSTAGVNEPQGYYAPPQPIVAPLAQGSGSGGLDMTTLLLIGVLVIFLMKR